MNPLLRAWRRRLDRTTRAVALFGGLVLVAAMLFTVVAVCMAALGRPILGDTEIVEFAAGVAVMSFMPYCQMQYGHVAITAFTGWAPQNVKAGLDVAAGIAFALVVIVLAVQLIVGGYDAYDRGRISMFLRLPRWWGFALAGVPAVLWMATAVFVVFERMGGGTEHEAEDAAQ